MSDMPDFMNPSKDLLAGLRAGRNEIDGAIEAEQARWQEAIYAECVDTSGHKELDGSGCDSGDPLDLTVAEVGMAIGYVIDQRDELKCALADVTDELRIARDLCDKMQEQRAAYARIPDNIDPDEAVVASRSTMQFAVAVGNDLDAAKARIAELAKLVEAAGNLRKAVAHLGETVQRDDDNGFRFYDDRLCKLSDRFTELMSALAEIEAAKEAEDDKD